MQGPETWLNILGIGLQCVVDPESVALVDADHRAFVNWEIYYFSNDATMTAFLQSPHEFAGLVTDPVSRERFQPSANSPRRDRGDHPFYFESEETLALFDVDPESYEIVMIGMREKN